MTETSIFVEGLSAFPPPDPALKPYEISVPGWQDIIHLVPENSLPEAQRRERKRARIRRIKASPVPEFVQRINSIMGYIDDAEDMLSTALVLGRPLIRRLPPGAIPLVGWILTARDIAEAMLAASSIIPRGRSGKNRLVDFVHNASLRSGARLKRVDRYLRMRPGLGAAVEGLQTLDTLAGVGLSFGPIMGASQDILFGLAQLALGQRLKIRLPDPTTPAGNAAYVLTFMPLAMMVFPILPVLTVFAIWAAIELSLGYLANEFSAAQLARTVEVLRQTPVPQALPRREETRELLREEGIDPDQDEPPPLPFLETNPTYDQWGQAILPWTRRAFLNSKMLFGPTIEGTFSTMGLIETTKQLFTWLEDTPDNVTYSPNMGDMIQELMFELPLYIDKRTYTAPLA